MEAQLGIEKKFEQVNYFEEDLALADSEDNDTYDDDNDWQESEESVDDADKIQVMDDSFNRDGGYISHGGGIQVVNLDIPPWQFDNME